MDDHDIDISGHAMLLISGAHCAESSDALLREAQKIERLYESGYYDDNLEYGMLDFIVTYLRWMALRKKTFEEWDYMKPQTALVKRTRTRKSRDANGSR